MKGSVASTSASAPPAPLKSNHTLPPPTATHPRDRWETLFVYAFITRFTDLKRKVEGFDNVADLEESILASGPHPLLHAVLARFVLNLRPNTRNTSAEKFSGTLRGALFEYFGKGERTVFWDDALARNVDPFAEMEGGSIFAAPWGVKLNVLRTLVELQLTHSAPIKAAIDAAWGVPHAKQKHKEAAAALDGGASYADLALLPLGQDCARRRYWIADDSPRVYVSTNPWKVTSAFEAAASTRAEYAALLARLRAEGADAAAEEEDAKKKKKKAKAPAATRKAHAALIDALVLREEVIDKEIARIERARKKAQQKAIALAQAEMRPTRTRRQVKRPDYVYQDDIESDDGADDFDPQGDSMHDVDDDMDADGFRSDSGSAAGGRRRRSTRNAAGHTNGHANGNGGGREWRGERRSARFAGPEVTDEAAEPPRKRARTVESASSDAEGMSVNGEDGGGGGGRRGGLGGRGAAKIKETETVVEQLAGKKRSKFWVYAVEPVAPAPAESEAEDGGGGEGEDGRASEESAAGGDGGDAKVEAMAVDVEHVRLEPPAMDVDAHGATAQNGLS